MSDVRSTPEILASLEQQLRGSYDEKSKALEKFLALEQRFGQKILEQEHNLDKLRGEIRQLRSEIDTKASLEARYAQVEENHRKERASNAWTMRTTVIGSLITTAGAIAAALFQLFARK